MPEIVKTIAAFLTLIAAANILIYLVVSIQ